MLLQFRTKRDINGNTRYLGVCTSSKTYSTQPSKWIDKEYPVITKKEIRAIIEKCKEDKYLEIDNI